MTARPASMCVGMFWPSCPTLEDWGHWVRCFLTTNREWINVRSSAADI